MLSFLFNQSPMTVACKLVCRTCGADFNSEKLFDRHLETHSKENIHCKICRRVFSTPSTLARHVKNAHNNSPKNKRFLCPTCGKTFPHFQRLVEHERIHTADKPCKYCVKAFRSGVNLNDHKRTHVGLRPFKCIECGHEYKKSGHLSRHLMTHTGEKPNVCSLCGRGFRRIYALNRHMKTTHHKEQCSPVPDDSPRTRRKHGNNTWFCWCCLKKFPSKLQLEKHEKFHGDVEMKEREELDEECGTDDDDMNVKNLGELKEKTGIYDNVRVKEEPSDDAVHELGETEKCFVTVKEEILEPGSELEDTRFYCCDHCLALFGSRIELTQHFIKCRKNK